MKIPKYPLEQVLHVKKDRVDKAEKVVKEKKRSLEIEEEKLKRVEMERNAVFNHHHDKLTQLRAALDEGTTSHEVLKMKNYLKVVKERLIKEDAKVKTQKEQVKIAQQNLDAALQDLKRKRLEAEKIELHQDEWKKDQRKEAEREEAKEQDEVGNTLFESQRRKRRQ
jgi:flagellar biosynthesis chaperone FliJ